MDELTPDHVGAVAKTKSQSDAQNSGKDAWVTPVVREYDPAVHTKAFFSGSAGTDNVIYS